MSSGFKGDKGKGVNETSVYVVHCPAGPVDRAVLQITVRFGKNQTVAEKVAFQQLLSSVQNLKEAVAAHKAA